MAVYLKRRKSGDELCLAGQTVCQKVSEMIQELEEGGDSVVCRYSAELDNWNPEQFRLDSETITRVIEALPEQVLADIRFAQEQIRHFAERQRE